MQSIGLIETLGMTIGLVAIDAAVKSANVKLLGYELSNGEGRTTFKITGDVGAVKAAIDAAKSIVEKDNGVVYTQVIARPSLEIEAMIRTADMVYAKKTESENNLEKEDQVLNSVEEKKEIVQVKEPEIKEKNNLDSVEILETKTPINSEKVDSGKASKKSQNRQKR